MHKLRESFSRGDAEDAEEIPVFLRGLRVSA